MKLSHPAGRAAEERALQFLQQQGCLLRERNWHCRYGEIDLIMQHGEMLLFVEVKFRRSNAFGGAAYSITPAKLAKLQRSAEHYLQTQHINPPCRLDAVLLQGAQTPQWIQNISG